MKRWVSLARTVLRACVLPLLIAVGAAAGWLPLLLLCLLVGVAAVNAVVLVVQRRLAYSWRLFERLVFLAPRLLFACVAAVAIRIAVPDSELPEAEAAAFVGFLWLLVGVAALLWLARRDLGHPAVSVAFAAGALPILWQVWLSHREPPDAIEIAMPLGARACVVQGGMTALVNHHAPFLEQAHAVDLVVGHGGAEVSTNLEAYPCYGTTVLAPVAGRVVGVEASLPDQALGSFDESRPGGNYVVIEFGQERFVVLAHLASGSVRVDVGQQVRLGEAIASCGNSGNTTEPHLHLQLQNRPTLGTDPTVRTFPLRFTGAATSPKRGDCYGPTAAW